MYRIFYFFIFIVFISSCTKPSNNGIPSYLKIDEVTLVTTPEQGSAIHGISDLWIESDGVNLGAFEYPLVVPGLFSGTRSVLVNAGVQQSGDFFIREIYPLYDVFETTATFIEKDTVVISPVFSYKSAVNFLLVEGFETSNIFTGLSRTDASSSENLEGRAATINLTTANSFKETTTGSTVAIPQGPRVYVEFHYKGTNDFGFGIESLINGTVSSRSFFAVMTPSEEWRKLYIDITNIVNVLNGEEYNFYINASLLDGETETNIYLDNFKVVTL